MQNRLGKACGGSEFGIRVQRVAVTAHAGAAAPAAAIPRSTVRSPRRAAVAQMRSTLRVLRRTHPRRARRSTSSCVHSGLPSGVVTVVCDHIDTADGTVLDVQIPQRGIQLDGHACLLKADAQRGDQGATHADQVLARRLGPHRARADLQAAQHPARMPLEHVQPDVILLHHHDVQRNLAVCRLEAVLARPGQFNCPRRGRHRRHRSADVGAKGASITRSNSWRARAGRLHAGLSVPARLEHDLAQDDVDDEWGDRGCRGRGVA